MKSKVFMITGMHRSGTSLTASLFQSVGVNIGEKLVGPEYGNIRGHFEDIEFVELHKGILCSQGIDDLGGNVEIKEIPVKKQYLKAAKRLIKNRQEENEKKSKSWGWKDPRTTLFLNFWLDLLPDAKFIFVYRSPWEVVDSIYRRGTDEKLLQQPEIAVKMWLDYNQRILDFYEQFSAQCLIGKVDSIGKNPESFIQAVNEKFEIDLAAPPPGNFAESLLVKDISETTKPSLIEKYFPQTLEVYQQLEKIGIGGSKEFKSQKQVRNSEVSSESKTHSRQSKIKSELELWEFRDWLNIRGLEKQINSLETDVERWQEIFREAKQKVGNLETELGETQQELDIRLVKLQQSSQKLELLEVELGKTQVQLEGKETNLQASQTKVVKLERKLGQTESQLENNQTKLEESQQKIIRLEIDLGQAQAQLDNSKTRFQEALVKILSLETELGKTQVQLEGTQIKLTESQKKLLGVETEFGQIKVQLEGNKVKLQESQEKIGILETELGQTQIQLNGNILKLQESQTQIKRLETELGKTQQKLDGTQVKLQESQAQIQLLETELGKTQQKLDGTQVKLQESQAQIQLLETELGNAQQKLDGTQVKLQESQAQIQLLETELGKTQTSLAQTQTTLEETKVELNAQNYETETLRVEVSAMKSSKFWKLREKWFTLKSQLQKLRPHFLFSIDSPINWQISNSEIEIVGWCFHNTFNIQNIRAKVGTEIFLGNYGISRPDVIQKYNDISTAFSSGFEIFVQLSPGNYELILEAENKKGEWQKFASYPISVSNVEANFDAPAKWQLREGEILFAGWCCHPEQKITKLVLKYGEVSIECAYGLRRKDVGEVFPDWVGSQHSGFEVTVEVPSGKWEISLEAYLESGEVVGFYCSEILELRRYGFSEKAKDKFQGLSKFAQAIWKRTAERQQRLGRILPLPSELPNIARQILTIYRQQQKQGGELLLPPGFVLPETIDVYDAWLAVNKWGDRSRQYLVSRLEGCRTPLPKISVVMPVYNPPVEFLRKGIASVQNQVYQNWEFCIADDCSSNPDIREILTEVAKTDSRIKLTFRSENGNISAATNSAAELATGDFILFLDNDDELTPDALGEVALYISQNPETDFLYSDDDKISTEGKRFDPQFKPEYSPELLLSYMYMGHLCVVRKEIFDKIGGLRVGFEGSQDYDFALRATEISRHVGHLPLVLYHWRTSPGSTAISGGEKPKSFLAGEKAVQESLNRRGIVGNIYHPDWAMRERLGIFKPTFPDQGDSVTIIIPTKNQAKLLKACIESLRKTTYQNYQVFVIDNESDESETLEYLASLKDLYFGEANISVIPIANTDGKFNFAAINNRAVELISKNAKTEYILFLNNDTEIISPNWLSQMMGYAKIPGVGAVGAKLIYPDQRIQHAGVIHGLHHGLAGHAFKLLHSENRGYLSQASVSRNYSAVTAACMLTSRKLFLDNGGFDEENFAVAYNDADYGYRLLVRRFNNSYRSVYCPDAELIHKEGTSRGYSDNPQEEANYRRKYSRMIDGFYSPHFSLESELFEIQPRRFFMKETGDRRQETGGKKESEVFQKSGSLQETGDRRQETGGKKESGVFQKSGSLHESGVRSQKLESFDKDSEVNVQAKVDDSQKDSELNPQTLQTNSFNEAELNAQAKVDDSQKDSELNPQTLQTNSFNEAEINVQAKFDNSEKESEQESEINPQTLETNSLNESELNAQAKVDNSQKDSELNPQTLEANSLNESKINTQVKVDNSQKESELNPQTLEANSFNESELNVQAKVDNSRQESELNPQTPEANFSKEGRSRKLEGKSKKFNAFEKGVKINSQTKSEINPQTLEANSLNESELNAQAKVDNSRQESEINPQTLEANSLNESELNAQAKVDNPNKESELNTQISEIDTHAIDSLFPVPYSLFPSNAFPRIKLLMCSNSLDLTGAPLHQLEIALKLAKDGIVKPIIFSVNDGELREIYQQQNIQVIVKDNPLEHIYQRDAYNAALTTFAQEIKSLNIDVMYINTLENFFMVDVAQMLNIPSVWNVHESQPWQTYFNRFGNEIAARALECFRYPYRIIFVSDATRNKYLPLNSHHNFTVVHNGLDLELLKKASAKWSRQEARSALEVKKDEIAILLLGTVCERKGQHDLVKSLSFIPEKEREKIKCFLVGDRPNLYSLKLHELVKNLPEEIQQRVEIVGETSETAKYYQAADIFVCTSRIESFPRVILEAMAYNLPIVTTPVFGIVEQVKPNINGLFYAPDNPEELANVLMSLLIDEELRQRLAGNAKYVLESLNTFAEMTETYGQIFQEAYFSLDKLADTDYVTDIRIKRKKNT
ncbi:glycosyltransferase [Dapis sp. BLCC M229]|uniref:glycosyltransferase n=1 Tax=Dapis sp. BLCC M229 TaxID=3400188 RepID=UPI003CF84860